METITLLSSLLGSESHMVVSQDGFSVSEKIPHGSWVLSGAPKNSTLCLDSFLRLHGVELCTQLPEKWIKMMSTLAPNSPIMWSKVLPSDVYKSHIKNIINVAVKNLNSLSKDYFLSTWVPCGAVLDSLKPAKVDSAMYRDFLGGTIGTVLETFKPGPGGYAPPVVYDRFGTRTGRLTVAKGPNILTLKREHRKILRSNFSDGAVFSIDFSALEARIILSEAGVNPGNGDVYNQISNELFDGKIPRDTVKAAVISELYGASKSLLGAKLGMHGQQLDNFVDMIRSYFKTSVLRKKLSDELLKTGKICNRFGRPLVIENKQSDHLLVNTYTQSTGVDVSLLGFKSIIDTLGSDGVRPLFVLHDALILDIRGDRLSDVEKISFVSVPEFKESFPLKLEVLN